MRFKAKIIGDVKNPKWAEHKGKWAVFHGSSAWWNTIGTEEFAKQEAAIMSMQWHQQQMDKCWDAIIKNASTTNSHGDEAALVNADGSRRDEGHTCSRGDMCC